VSPPVNQYAACHRHEYLELWLPCEQAMNAKQLHCLRLWVMN
jgi:hypothetical protein